MLILGLKSLAAFELNQKNYYWYYSLSYQILAKDYVEKLDKYKQALIKYWQTYDKNH